MEKGKNDISRRFTTMMPLDVFSDFHKFAKEISKTALGKFDYSVAIRFLLKYKDFNEKIESLQVQVNMLENEVNSLRNNQPTKQEEEGVKTFGGNKR